MALPGRQKGTGREDLASLGADLRDVYRRLRAIHDSLPASGPEDKVRSGVALVRNGDPSLSVRQAAAVLDLSESWVRTLIRNGDLEARRARNGRLWVSGRDTLRLHESRQPPTE